MHQNRSATDVEQLRQEARDYYALCDRAAERGIPVSLDDPRPPRTVADLQAAVDEREAQR